MQEPATQIHHSHVKSTHFPFLSISSSARGRINFHTNFRNNVVDWGSKRQTLIIKILFSVFLNNLCDMGKFLKLCLFVEITVGHLRVFTIRKGNPLVYWVDILRFVVFGDSKRFRLMKREYVEITNCLFWG